MKLDELGLNANPSMFRKNRLILTGTSTLASEFVLGQTGCRSDLAIWNGSFIGVEVKSARDFLARLPNQITAYRRFFDLVIVLCDEVHGSKAEQICGLDVGVYVWKNGGHVEAVRPPALNHQIDRMACTKALTLRQLQTALGVKTTSRMPRLELERCLMVDQSIDARKVLISGFEASYRATSASFWLSIRGKRISKSHLPLLSRFAPAREGAQRLQSERRDFWIGWSQRKRKRCSAWISRTTQFPPLRLHFHAIQRLYMKVDVNSGRCTLRSCVDYVRLVFVSRTFDVLRSPNAKVAPAWGSNGIVGRLAEALHFIVRVINSKEIPPADIGKVNPRCRKPASTA